MMANFNTWFIVQHAALGYKGHDQKLQLSQLVYYLPFVSTKEAASPHPERIKTRPRAKKLHLSLIVSVRNDKAMLTG